jgi:hypothetical protein
MSERKRVNIKAILADPVLREEIVEGATDFICKVEGIRPHSLSPAAQAVLDAVVSRPSANTRGRIVAALRTAAQLIAEDEMERYAPDILRDIAAELGVTHD